MLNVSSSVDQSIDAIQINQKSKRIYSQDIQNLFLDIAKRIDEVDQLLQVKNSLYALKKFIPIDEIIYEINDTEPILLIQYIKQIIFYLSKVKMELEEKVQRAPEEDDQNNYESLIQKLEAEVRQHIRVNIMLHNQIEQQQRLHIENLQQKLEETMFKNQEVENELGSKYQELQSLNQKLFNVESEYYTKTDSQRDSSSRIQKSQDRQPKNTNKVQKLNQTNYINNIHVSQIQPRQQPILSNESSIPTSQVHLNSLSAHKASAGDKLNDPDQQQHKPQQQKRTNKSQNNNSVQQLPLQLKALFNKVYNEREGSQPRSQHKQNLSKTQFQKNKYNEAKSYETSYKDEYQNHNKMVDSSDHGDYKRAPSRNGQGQKDSSRTKLQTDFIETDRMREELFKQFGQTQQQNAYLTHRVNQNSIDGNSKTDLQKSLKDTLTIQQKSRGDKKDMTKQELSKSSSFDGTSNRMVKIYRREVKPQSQVSTSQQRQAQNVCNYLKKQSTS